jgi:protein TonB
LPATSLDLSATLTASPPPVVAAPVTSAAPAGPTFEATHVDVRPQVASRVEARLPAASTSVRGDEVVVLRVLVSPAGHPADVRLLRGSRTDPAADRAALAAVRQWRFTPARKRGQLVSCWFNVGVPVRAAGS